MANLNLNVQIFPFFDSVKNPLDSSKTSDSFKNPGYDNLSLELSGTGSAVLAIEGCINTQDENGMALEDTDCSWSPLAILSAKNYSQAQSVSGNGIYFIGVSGISRIRVVASSVSGEVTVVGAFSK